jgi:hypothetical protein
MIEHMTVQRVLWVQNPPEDGPSTREGGVPPGDPPDFESANG